MDGMRDNPLMRKAALMVAIAVMSAVAVGVSAAAGREARMDASRILGSLRLPPGAREVAADPSSGRLLRSSPSNPLVPHLVDVHGFWRVSGDPGRVLAWVDAHAPAGAHRNLSGASLLAAARTASFEGFELPDVSGRLSNRELLVTVTSARGGGTALRADAQSAPIARRTAAERIPARVDAITISEHRVSGSSSGPWKVTRGARIRRIVALVNALPPAPTGPIACPADMGPYVTLTFMKAGHAVARAIADGSGCGFVGLTIRHRREPFLAGGPSLISRLSSLLGARLG